MLTLVMVEIDFLGFGDRRNYKALIRKCPIF
jgi:hypothetical protein